MDVQKLHKAASLLKTTNPTLSEEIIKLAQEIQSQSVLPESNQQIDQSQAQPPIQDPAAAHLNPNIKNYSNPAMADAVDNTETHTVSFTINMPKGKLDETALMNSLAPIVQKMQDTNGISITGYKFQRST